MTPKSNVLYLSHGGGPLPLLGDSDHRQMVDLFKTIAARIPKPKAALVISAHWEEAVPTLTSGANPALIYDYYGFPPESYAIRYPAPGNPALAIAVADRLRAEGFTPALDVQRGFDHGLFVPMKILYPDADIPCVQLSLIKSLDPANHIRMGRALAHLRDENILVVASGFSFHNLRAFFKQPTDEDRCRNEDFEAWLVETCTSTEISETEREKRLLEWDKAPGARFCHPREEHLLPLHVCYGATGSAAAQAHSFTILGKKSSVYVW